MGLFCSWGQFSECSHLLWSLNPQLCKARTAHTNEESSEKIIAELRSRVSRVNEFGTCRLWSHKKSTRVLPGNWEGSTKKADSTGSGMYLITMTSTGSNTVRQSLEADAQTVAGLVPQASVTYQRCNRGLAARCKAVQVGRYINYLKRHPPPPFRESKTIQVLPTTPHIRFSRSGLA